MPSRRLAATARALVVTFLALAGAAPARAQSPSLASLRARLQELRAHRPATVPRGTVDTIAYLIDTAERIETRFPVQAAEWRARAASYLDRAATGHDPLPEQRGRIISRGYRSPISERIQGYAIYIPPTYDPSKSYPLMIVLHGGSSNGNLFLGVVLGNNMSWLEYDQHLWDEFTPVWSPDWIVVAPDGYGQVLWRWMGEQDVLDVLADVERHYHIDPDRVHLHGLSNGGIGAHNIGMRHAWRFAGVTAMAGAPSWLQYAGARTPEDRLVMSALSGMQLLENSYNTDYRYHHGRRDPGPMRPGFIEELDALVAQTGAPARGTWHDAGHDLLYIVHRHGRIYAQLADMRRNTRPAEVRVVSGDYRAARQHWLSLARIEQYPRIARAVAKAEGDTLTVTTERVRAFSVDFRDVPLSPGETARVVVDGVEVYAGPRAALGHVLHLVRDERGWRTGFPEPAAAGVLEKRPGLSGPIADAYYDRMVHVYGTADPAARDALRRAAERGARGWPLWLWSVQQRVVADTEVTDELRATATLVLYGAPGQNAELDATLAHSGPGALPIRVDGDAVVVGERRYVGADVGTRFIYPNPRAPGRYVIVQTGISTQAVVNGNNLPDFLPDWVVYDGSILRERQRLVLERRARRAMGFFDDAWRLRESDAEAQGSATPRQSPGGADIGGVRPSASPGAGAAAWNAWGTGLEPGGDDGPLAVPTTARGGAPSGFVVALRRRMRLLDAPDAGAGRRRSPGSGLHFVALAGDADGEPSARASARPLHTQWPLDFEGRPVTPELPIPPAPPRPPPPADVLPPRGDPARGPALGIANRVATFPNFRGDIPGATWRVDEGMAWRIRPQRQCLNALRTSGVPARLLSAEEAAPIRAPVPTPVEITGPINGVTFEPMRDDGRAPPEPGTLAALTRRRLITSCELAARLVDVARVLRRHGVRRVDVLSALRGHPRASFHTFGLALDLARFHTDDGAVLDVARSFIVTPAHETCTAPEPADAAARTLLRIACDLAATGKLSTVLTPNYNAGHRDHFHIDARPDDPRVFVR